MRAVIQRVTHGKVSIGGRTAAEIGAGFVILLGIEMDDTRERADALAKKVASLRVFSDEAGKMNLSLLDTGGSAVVVSQFTLMADTRKGNRPSFTKAAPPENAIPLVDHFCDALRALGVPTQTGEFGAEMLVEIHNDGPVTILLDMWSAPALVRVVTADTANELSHANNTACETYFPAACDGLPTASE